MFNIFLFCKLKCLFFQFFKLKYLFFSHIMSEKDKNLPEDRTLRDTDVNFGRSLDMGLPVLNINARAFKALVAPENKAAMRMLLWATLLLLTFPFIVWYLASKMVTFLNMSTKYASLIPPLCAVFAVKMVCIGSLIYSHFEEQSEKKKNE